MMRNSMTEKNKSVEIASESCDDSVIEVTAKKPRSRERGPDKKSRTYRASSMSNLTQFKKRHEEFAQYLKDVKGVDLTGNSGIVKAILILGLLGFAGLGGWWLYNHYKKREDENTENRH